MPQPYRFISGTIARSAQVNANFDYLMSIVGTSAAAGVLAPSKKIILGPRATALLTSEHDTGSATYNFTQLSWNANWTSSAGVWKFARKLPSLGATAIRVGDRGLEVLSAYQTVGDLNQQMATLFRVDADSSGKFAYMPDDLHFSNVNAAATTMQRTRNTIVFLDTPVAIYLNKLLTAGTSVLNANTYGIPRHAQAILVRLELKAAASAAAAMYMYPQSAKPNIYQGLVVYAPITGSGAGQYAGGQGLVPLGRGAYLGQFNVKRVATFASATVHILGYLT